MYWPVLLHEGQEDWAREVQASIRETAAQIGLGHVDFRYLESIPADETGLEAPGVVVLLSTPSTAYDNKIDAALRQAVMGAIPIVPIHLAADRPSTTLPPLIKTLNAARWEAPGLDVCMAILRALGLSERDRRAFVSYRRVEASKVAEQLHTALTQRGFDVFLDRFSIAIGEDFMRRIDVELGDKSFVVVVESPGLLESEAVQHEISYALTHHIVVLAVTLPETTVERQITGIDAGFRFIVPAGDYAEVLSGAALDRLLEEIELRYSLGVRRRRDQLLGSVVEWLANNGCESTLAGEWAVLATGTGKVPEVFSVATRTPSARDLYFADQLRDAAAAAMGTKVRATVVHESEHIDPDSASVLDWVCQPRDLTTLVMRDGPRVLEDAQ